MSKPGAFLGKPLFSNRPLFEAARTLAAILLSLAIAAIIIFFTSENPLHAIRIFLTAPFQSSYNFG